MKKIKKGDAVARIAKPIAKTIDYVFHTNVQNCASCNRTQSNLNSGMSYADAFYDRFWPKEKQTNKKRKKIK